MSQLLQTLCSLPSLVHVGLIISFHSLYECPKASTTSCLINTSLHTEQCFPSVKPVSVHVGSTFLSITSVCPKASTTSCLINTSLHTEQCFPSVKPVSVHVGYTFLSITSVCPKAST